MDQEEESYLRRAGRVAARALAKAADIIHEGMPVRELCEKVEALMYVDGCEPSFPLNVSVNDVAAHDTAELIDNGEVIPQGSVVKIDAGAHCNGYISDTAITVSFNKEAEVLVEASRSALTQAIQALSPGISVSQLSSKIEEVIRGYSVRPISDLTGHTIERYRLHAGLSIPNVATKNGHRLVEGSVFAIEPFTTFGEGRVYEDRNGKIYSGIRRIRSPIKFDDKIMNYAVRERKTMPFTDRWLASSGKAEDIRSSIKRLVRFGAIYEYKVLKERSAGLVAQFEHTIIMTPEGPIVTTEASTGLT